MNVSKDILLTENGGIFTRQASDLDSLVSRLCDFLARHARAPVTVLRCEAPGINPEAGWQALRIPQRHHRTAMAFIEGWEQGLRYALQKP